MRLRLLLFMERERERQVWTQKFHPPHLIPSFALAPAQIYHVGPSSPEDEIQSSNSVTGVVLQ